MKYNQIQSLAKATRKRLKDGSFSAFSGIDYTALDKAAFTEAIKKADHFSRKVRIAINYVGTEAEQVILYTKSSYAIIVVPIIVPNGQTTCRLNVSMSTFNHAPIFQTEAKNQTSAIGCFHFQVNDRDSMEHTLLHIHNILVIADNVAKAYNEFTEIVTLLTGPSTEQYDNGIAHFLRKTANPAK